MTSTINSNAIDLTLGTSKCNNVANTRKPRKISDCNLILTYLSDCQWHNAIEIAKALKPGCINWALRSRISNLKQKHWDIESRLGYNRMAEYRLKDKQGELF